jgi:DNA-binding transcriptional LysR family regulator
MLLSQIEYFQAIVEMHSFTKAADQCHVSQSAVSQQLKALEEELGTALLERHNRTFSITPAGEIFYHKTKQWMQQLKGICQDTRQTGKEKAILKIGYLSCYGGNEFQNAAAEFARRYPNVKINIVNGNHEELYQALRNDEADIILSDQRRAFNEDYVNLELVRSRTFIQISSANPLSKQTSIEMKDLKDTPCIIVSSKQENERDYYQNTVGFQGEILFADSLMEARILTAANKGVMPIEGIHPSEYYDQSVKMLPLMKHGRQIFRRYFAFWSKENSGYYVEEFADMLKRQFTSETD